MREEQEEKDEDGAALRAVLDQPLSQEAKAGLYELLAEGFEVREPNAEYLVRRALTEQDRTIYALCRPERLLRMALAFTVFDGGRRKIVRDVYGSPRMLRELRNRGSRPARRALSA